MLRLLWTLFFSSIQGTFYSMRKNNQYACLLWARRATPACWWPAWWHLARAVEASRTPRLISVRAKWQPSLSVASHTSAAPLKIWLDSVLSFPSDKPQPLLPLYLPCTQPICRVTSRLQAVSCMVAFCFTAHLILCWHTFPPPLLLPNTCSHSLSCF